MVIKMPGTDVRPRHLHTLQPGAMGTTTSPPYPDSRTLVLRDWCGYWPGVGGSGKSLGAWGGRWIGNPPSSSVGGRLDGTLNGTSDGTGTGGSVGTASGSLAGTSVSGSRGVSLGPS